MTEKVKSFILFRHVSLQVKVFAALMVMTTLATLVLMQVSLQQNSEILLRKTIREQRQNAELAADGVASVMNHVASLSKLTSQTASSRLPVWRSG